jgi:AraC-like DNA-binding protein
MTKLPDPLLPRPEGAEHPAGSDAVVPVAYADVLSDVLHCVRLNGSMFFLVDATTPWMSRVPEAGTFAQAVLPGSQRLISYHVVVEGACWGAIEGEPPQRLEAGDILVIPHGAPYYLANPAGTPASYSDAETVSFFRRMVAGDLPPVVTEGGGGPEKTRLICGFLGCDARAFNPVLAALPPVLCVRRAAQAGSRFAHLTEFAQSELREQRAGNREVLLRLSELMFIAAMGCHIESLADSGSGWLAGLRDPLVARVLSLLHARPARAWTLDELACEAGTSRSVLVARFKVLVGLPPMRYLAAWRMQLATRLLAEREGKVRAVAEAVGYDSEAAFSRAFTRHVGSNPAAWRDAARQRER